MKTRSLGKMENKRITLKLKNGSKKLPKVKVTSKPTTGTPTWVPFNVSILEQLPPGQYPLRQKQTVTPPVPTVALCSPEDQVLFGEVDNMEKNLLDTSLKTKLMDINKSSARLVVASNGLVSGAKGEVLYVFKNEFVGQKEKRFRRELGAMMEMAYEMIMIPVPLYGQKR